MYRDTEFNELWKEHNIFCGYFEYEESGTDKAVPFIMRYNKEEDEEVSDLNEFFDETITVKEIFNYYNNGDISIADNLDDNYLNSETSIFCDSVEDYAVIMGVNDDCVLTDRGVNLKDGKHCDGDELRETLYNEGKLYAL